MSLWKKIDLDQSPPHYLKPGDNCYYAREYVSKGGFSASKANQLISNFKKGMDRKGTWEWKHKINAVQQFAEELSPVLTDEAFVCAIPASRCKTDSAYDPRLDSVLIRVRKLRPKISIVEPLFARTTLQAAHLGGKRTPSTFYNNLEWKNCLPDSANHLILIDDVITTGGHFKACQKMITEHLPGIQVIGMFWAKTVWPDEPEQNVGQLNL